MKSNVDRELAKSSSLEEYKGAENSVREDSTQRENIPQFSPLRVNQWEPLMPIKTSTFSSWKVFSFSSRCIRDYFKMYQVPKFENSKLRKKIGQITHRTHFPTVRKVKRCSMFCIFCPTHSASKGMLINSVRHKNRGACLATCKLGLLRGEKEKNKQNNSKKKLLYMVEAVECLSQADIFVYFYNMYWVMVVCRLYHEFGNTQLARVVQQQQLLTDGVVANASPAGGDRKAGRTASRKQYTHSDYSLFMLLVKSCGLTRAFRMGIRRSQDVS